MTAESDLPAPRLNEATWHSRLLLWLVATGFAYQVIAPTVTCSIDINGVEGPSSPAPLWLRIFVAILFGLPLTRVAGACLDYGQAGRQGTTSELARAGLLGLPISVLVNTLAGSHFLWLLRELGALAPVWAAWPTLWLAASLCVFVLRAVTVGPDLK